MVSQPSRSIQGQRTSDWIPIHHFKWAESKGFHRDFLVCEKSPWKTLTPGVTKVIHHGSQHGFQCPVEMLTRTVGLWMIWTTANLCNAKLIRKELREFTSKLCTLITQYLLRKTEMGENLRKSICNHFSCMLLKCNGLWIVSCQVHTSQNETVSRLWTNWQWTHYINGYSGPWL